MCMTRRDKIVKKGNESFVFIYFTFNLNKPSLDEGGRGERKS